MKYLVFLFLFCSLAVNGQKKPWEKSIKSQEAFPQHPDNYVTDQGDILRPSQQDLLNKKLKAFEESTSNQVFIYLTESLDGKNLEDYSREIFNTWGVGQKDKDNGVLITIFIKDRVYRIQVGKGLEKTLPSDLTLIIQDDYMRPHFREEDYYKGIDAGIDQLIFYTDHEFNFFRRYSKILIGVGVAYLISMLFFYLNLRSIKKWKNQPKRRKKNMLAFIIFLLIPGLGTIVLAGLYFTINEKSQSMYNYETDDQYERRMDRERDRSNSDSSSSSDDSFSGGGGGSSDSGGSSSSW